MRYRNSHFWVFLVLTLWAFLLPGPEKAHSASGPAPKNILKKANHCREALYRSSDKRKYRHNWMSCIKTYKKIYTRHPDSDEAAWAMYHSARMYLGLHRYSGWQQDLDESIRIFRKLAATYPKHRLADDAQYRIGELYYVEKKDPTQAYVEFLKVDIKFPTGDMRPKARKMMDKLAVHISKREQAERKKKETVSDRRLTRVKDIRHWSTPTYTRVVVDLEQAVAYEFHLLKEDPGHKKPRRLYLDLKNTYVSADIESTIPIRDGLLQRARAGQHTNDTVRVVLDITCAGAKPKKSQSRRKPSKRKDRPEKASGKSKGRIKPYPWQGNWG
ncbi:MAG: AMIN domain-containing protein [Deltaproteobacteria bacterium]|nr:AMIN domain-containing protein [Deltaproteobacteria bacterium]